MKQIFVLLAACAAFVAPAPDANAASIDGLSVQVDRRAPDLGTTTNTSGVVSVTGGIEYTGNSFSVDVSGNSIEYIRDPFGGLSTFNDLAFNGIVVTDILDSFGDFTSATLTTFLLDDGDPVLTFDANNIFLSFSDVTTNATAGGNVIARVDFTIEEAAIVPLPASGLLLLSGLSVAFAIRRRRVSNSG